MDFSHRRKRRGSSELNLTPLIDVVFNLLIFFLITSTFVQNPGIEVELPKASTSPDTSAAESVIIAVTEEGRYVYEGQAVSEEELRERLTAQHEKRKKAMVIIQADMRTPHGKVVDIMDMAREVGFSQLAIATEAEP